jgi:hypothetical protein
MAIEQSNPLQQDFICPVCRAKQVPQPECRRCSADLSLYLKAKQSWHKSHQQLQSAEETGDERLATKMRLYLGWLNPT